MAIQNDNTVLNKGDLKAYHEKILPYLGGNMMMQTGVSNYYSTDEKMVGVWVDGKPVYQKTYLFNSPSTSDAKTDVISSIPENMDKLIEFKGTISSGNYRYNINDWRSAEDYSTCWIRPSTIAMSVSSNLINCLCTLTIKYTKTTDTATTALTTPGAYDLNRPDLWPENQEIFFGNGLYGQRFTGTITAAKNTPNNTLIMTGLQNGSIINWGGNWIDADGNQMGAGSYKGDTVQSLVQLNKTNLNGQLFFSTNDNTGARTNAPYNIWVTYTK